MTEEAIDTLFKIKRHGVGPCLLSCNFLIDKLVEHGKVDVAVALLGRVGFEEAADTLREMEKVGVTPNVFTYTAYLQGLCKHGRSDFANEVLRALIGENLPMDVFGCGAEIHGFVKEKN
ncbi:Pentatricopeptide repeat-containing protein [Abeliophyllum distichum]|uniref:Pentatricopeptide repeat-containing protein n=1 Tax=Abeliophyllum distichum TaxID=126358 RepID=A0ABD1VTY4_9LAMI